MANQNFPAHLPLEVHDPKPKFKHSPSRYWSCLCLRRARVPRRKTAWNWRRQQRLTAQVAVRGRSAFPRHEQRRGRCSATSLLLLARKVSCCMLHFLFGRSDEGLTLYHPIGQLRIAHAIDRIDHPIDHKKSIIDRSNASIKRSTCKACCKGRPCTGLATGCKVLRS